MDVTYLITGSLTIQKAGEYCLSCWLIPEFTSYPLPPADYPGLKKENKVLPRTFPSNIVNLG